MSRRTIYQPVVTRSGNDKTFWPEVLQTKRLIHQPKVATGGDQTFTPEPVK